MVLPSRSRPTEPPVVLVVDADTEAGRLLAGYLSSQGFVASHSSRGEEAVRLARSRRLGLAIVDVSLQDMSGLALASWLKEVDRAIPILMTTGDYRPELEMRARQVGVLYYAQKPVDYERLQAIVTKAMSGGSNLSWRSPAGRSAGPLG